MVTNSTVAKILNNFNILPITEEDRVYTSEQTIRVHAMHYSDFDQEVNAFIQVLTEKSLART